MSLVLDCEASTWTLDFVTDHALRKPAAVLEIRGIEGLEPSAIVVDSKRPIRVHIEYADDRPTQV